MVAQVRARKIGDITGVPKRRWLGLVLATEVGQWTWAGLNQTVKNLPAMQESQVQSLDWEDSLEKGMATHSGILAWRTP